jgi:hypothetical protein
VDGHFCYLDLQKSRRKENLALKPVRSCYSTVGPVDSFLRQLAVDDLYLVIPNRFACSLNRRLKLGV